MYNPCAGRNDIKMMIDQSRGQNQAGDRVTSLGKFRVNARRSADSRTNFDSQSRGVGKTRRGSNRENLNPS